MNTFSFPGLGIEKFTVDKIAFTVFGKSVAWYGILITIGMILAFLYVLYRAKQEGVRADDIFDFAIFAIILGIIGARMYYVIMKWDNYVVTGGTFFENLRDTFLNIIAIWNGGLGIYGGLIVGGIVLCVIAKIKKISIMKMLDMAAPAVMIGQIIGRWGNFLNAEAYGTVTDLPWRMGIHYSKSYAEYVHPTFLYESLWNLIGFVIINLVYRHKKKDGQIFYMYLVWYGFGRFFIEGLRTDSLMVGPFRASQIVAAVSFIVGLIALIDIAKKAKLQKALEGEYENVYHIPDEDAENMDDADDGLDEDLDADADDDEDFDNEIDAAADSETEEKGE